MLCCRRLCLGIAGDDGLGGDRAGVGGKRIPSRLRAGHVEVSGNLEHFLRQRFVEHRIQAGKVGLDEVDVVRHARKLIHEPRYVDLREHGLHFFLAHAAVHQGLDLCEQSQVLGQRALIHLG